MTDPDRGEDVEPPALSGVSPRYKREFWSQENRKHVPAHYRLRKTAGIVNRIAAGRPCDLLDVGCGPGTLGLLLDPAIRYFGIDIAVHDPAPNLIEADIVETPIRFGDRTFDIVVAQGLFEYLGTVQATKFEEISRILADDGTFVVTYTNFGHRRRDVSAAYSNVQPLEAFRADLARWFDIRTSFPTSHNWHHGQPRRTIVTALNMHINVHIPLISPALAVEYFFVCTPRRPR